MSSAYDLADDQQVAWTFERAVVGCFDDVRVAWTELNPAETVLEAMLVMPNPGDWQQRLALLHMKGQFELAHGIRIVCMFQSPEDAGDSN